MKIGIIGAMEQEISLLLDVMKETESSTIAGIEFYSGTIGNRNVIVTKSGIGKVAASMATTILLHQFEPDFVINTGSAGGFVDGLTIGDIVVSNEVCYHDVDVTAFGYAIGQMAGQPKSFMPDATLINIATRAINKLDNGVKGVLGLICSGDSFIADAVQHDTIVKNFPAISACEMEAAAIAQVCHSFNKPFVIIRSLSDNANDDASMNFDEFLVIAGKRSAELIILMLGFIND